MVYFTSTDLPLMNELNSRGLNPANVTKQWVELIKHPAREEWAACIPEDFLPRMGEILGNDAETVASNLKTQEQMLSEGWLI